MFGLIGSEWKHPNRWDNPFCQTIDTISNHRRASILCGTLTYRKGSKEFYPSSKGEINYKV